MNYVFRKSSCISSFLPLCYAAAFECFSCFLLSPGPITVRVLCKLMVQHKSTMFTDFLFEIARNPKKNTSQMVVCFVVAAAVFAVMTPSCQIHSNNEIISVIIRDIIVIIIMADGSNSTRTSASTISHEKMPFMLFREVFSAFAWTNSHDHGRQQTARRKKKRNIARIFLPFYLSRCISNMRL